MLVLVLAQLQTFPAILESSSILMSLWIDSLSMDGSSRACFLSSLQIQSCLYILTFELFPIRVVDAGPFFVTANFVIVQGKLTIGTRDAPYAGKITFTLTLGNYSYGWIRPDGEDNAGVKAFVIVRSHISPFLTPLPLLKSHFNYFFLSLLSLVDLLS